MVVYLVVCLVDLMVEMLAVWWAKMMERLDSMSVGKMEWIVVA